MTQDNPEPFFTIRWNGETIRCYLHPDLHVDAQRLQTACVEAAENETLDELEVGYQRVADDFDFRLSFVRPGGHSDPLEQLVSVGFLPRA